MMTENIDLNLENTFNEFEEATALQIAFSKGRGKPNKEDMSMAVAKAKVWNQKRELMNLPQWC